MIKEERHQCILKLLHDKKIITVSEFSRKLDVTEMTIRRDLQELADLDLLIRIHGGARLLAPSQSAAQELSHKQKRKLHPAEKRSIAQTIAQEIENQDTVFLGVGTTIEGVYNFLDAIDSARIVTNSIHIFEQFKYDDRFELLLVGGIYRSKSGSFIGALANDFIQSIHVQKAFIGVNAINGTAVFNANEDEGTLQRQILDNAHKRYIVADSHKFNQTDFYQFYDLKDATHLVTDEKLSDELLERYNDYLTVMHTT